MDIDAFIVLSENLVGLDFMHLYRQSAVLELVRLSEEMQLYDLEVTREWGFDEMQFRKGEW